MISVITLFSGYDSQCLALRRLGVDFELVAWSEIDPHAIKAHNALFPEYANRNLGDITHIDWNEFYRFHSDPIDILTYSSPCQDFSIAGLQRGGTEGSGTRSSLLWEVERAIDALHPRYLILENVAALVSKKFIALFHSWCDRLASKGYHNYWQLLNAKNYGVPQSRKRVFMVSKYQDSTPYYFPKPYPLEKRLKDVLEQDVDERYYLSNEKLQWLMKSTEKNKNKGNGFAFAPKTADSEYAVTITTMAGNRPTDNFIIEPKTAIAAAAIRGRDTTNPNHRGHTNLNYVQQLQIGSPHTANALTTVAKDSLIVEQTIVSPGHGYFKGAEHSTVAPTCKASAMREQHFVKEQQLLGWSRDNHGNISNRHPVSIANTLTVAKRDNTQNYVQETTPTTTRVRRLTERELFRLMDVDEPDINTLLSAGISNTQLAHLAGNSIVVNVLYHIFRKLIVEPQPEKNTQLKIL